MPTSHDPVSIAALPGPLHWHGAPTAWELPGGNTLNITAGAKTDWFIDPDNGFTVDNAPALMLDADGPYMLRTRLTATHKATYDAAVIAVYASPQTWAKFCLELSPHGQVTVVSVVTKGVSDDCNSLPLSGNTAWFRVSKLGRAYAFHYSADGEWWNLIRYFTLGDVQARIGFLAQSPTGDGCTATFRDISFAQEKLADVRSGV
ncbi:MAG: DUF1349 domain-containing protein [Anaerolineae bacterium]|nr:DUF1349 domain-containing protein [Anaerolineae bacterium]